MLQDKESVLNELYKQIDRVQKIIKVCEGSDPRSAKKCIADMMQESVNKAEQVARTGDIVQLIQAWADVKSWEY